MKNLLHCKFLAIQSLKSITLILVMKCHHLIMKQLQTQLDNVFDE